MNNIWIIAQAGNGSASQTLNAEDMDSVNETTTLTSQDVNNSNPQPGKKKNDPGPLTWVLPIIMIFMVFMLFRGPKKQQQQRKKLEQSLEKNDRVLTIGGIYGTIVEIKEDEITLKVDESNNTKIKVKRSAIGRNMSKD